MCEVQKDRGESKGGVLMVATRAPCANSGESINNRQQLCWLMEFELFGCRFRRPRRRKVSDRQKGFIKVSVCIIWMCYAFSKESEAYAHVHGHVVSGWLEKSRMSP